MIKSTEPSRQLYAKFLEALRVGYKPGKIHGGRPFSKRLFASISSTLVQSYTDGKFGAMMNVSLINEVHQSSLALRIPSAYYLSAGTCHVHIGLSQI